MLPINRTWSNPRERAAIFSLWAGLGGMAMAAGPLPGGVLIGVSGYLALLAIGSSARYGALAWPLPAIGLAASLITPATTAALMACVDRSRAGIAAGVLNAARQTAAALGVALSGGLIATRPSIAEGMRASWLIAAMMSSIAAMVWWRASTQSSFAAGDINTARRKLPRRRAG
jgi:DHA2 family methylenomycin A resistance protein-like MFS transporter